MSDSIASRIKNRVEIKARRGRVGGTEHKNLVAKRRKEVEERKKKANMKIEC